MLKSRTAWLALAALSGLGLSFWGGCSGSGENDSASANASNGVCGNGVKEGTEECDDGNTDDTDACRVDCSLPACGDGVVQTGEECDDGNDIDDDLCSNDCVAGSSLCGNGVIDAGEACDDGIDGVPQNSPTCDVDCTIPECGDGIVNDAFGETCEPTELGDCPDCGQGGGGNDCSTHVTYKGIVTNDQNPLMPGSGIPSVWSYGGQLGIQAGNDMCAAIGADHVCTYGEVVEAEAKGELSGLPEGTEFWIHRVTETVPCLVGGCNGGMTNDMSPPGPGGRCNEWTYPTNHISDGEFAAIDSAGTPGANAQKIGTVIYYTDDDTVYTAITGDGHQCSPAAKATSHNNGGQPGCAGLCGSAAAKAILCCNPVCVR